MPHTQFPTLSHCALCGIDALLQRSHLLPNFLFKRLRGESGQFLAASRPRKPLQAGPVAQLLCYDCEQRFSKCEDQAKRIFYPEEKQPGLPIKYGTWLQSFAISISWRALTFLKYSTRNPYATLSAAAERLLPHLPSEVHERAEASRLQWGNALCAERAPSAQNDQHILFLNGKNYPNEHSAIVGFTVCHTDSFTAVFSQLGPICVLGVLHDARPLAWKNTRVQSLGGKFHAATQRVPESFSTWLKSYFDNIAEIKPQPSFGEVPLSSKITPAGGDGSAILEPSVGSKTPMG